MDDTVSNLNINGEVFVFSESGLSNNGIIDKVLPDSITVVQRSSHGVEGGGWDIFGGDGLSLDNVHLQHVSGDGSTHLLVGFKAGVGGGKDGVRSSSQGDSVGGEGGSEFIE